MKIFQVVGCETNCCSSVSVVLTTEQPELVPAGYIEGVVLHQHNQRTSTPGGRSQIFRTWTVFVWSPHPCHLHYLLLNF